MNEQEKSDLRSAAFQILLTGGGRDAVEQIGKLDGVDYRIDKTVETDIRVMSVNVEFVDWDPSDPKKERYRDRMRLIAECINLYAPDFVGLQECCQVMREPLNPHLDKRYVYAEFEASKPNIEYFPIVYRADLWEAVRSGAGEYPPANRPWGYVWATFRRLTAPHDEITVMNLHYMPAAFVGRGETWDEYREPLVRELNGFVKQRLAEKPHIPIVITGDYNTPRRSELYEMTVSGLPLEEAALLTEDSNMEPSRKWDGPVDHITVSRENAEVVAHRELDYYPTKTTSDHWHYVADIRHKKGENDQ